MAGDKPINKIQQGGLRRRLQLSVAGAKGGAGLLTSRARGLLLDKEEQQKHNEQALAREAKRFVRELGKLKGAYVKIGQMMALYGEHMLPSQVTKALHDLEDQTIELQWPLIEQAIALNLGEKQRGLEIEEQAIAAASLSQVHKAVRLIDEAELCLKVQYPGINKTIDSDFAMVLQMLKLTRWVKQGRDFESWAREIKQLLHEEVDYFRELEMTEQMRKNLLKDTRYIVPSTYPELSTSTLLTMDYVAGLDVSDAKVQRLSLKRRNQLASAMLELFFKEIFEWGLMQTDPNFGNYRIQLDKQQDKLVLLDFGAVRELADDFTTALKQTVLGAYQQDIPQMINGLIGLNCLKVEDSEESKQSLAGFCLFIFEPLQGDFSNVPDYALNRKKQYRWQESKLLRRAGKKAASSVGGDDFSLPSKEFTLLVRKLTGVFTFISTLKAEFNGGELLEKYL